MKKTLHLQASRPEDVQRAAEILRRGGLVAFATETVYGLGANALSADAVACIFQAKDRPAWDPLIVHVPAAEQISKVAKVGNLLGPRVQALAEAFWPGPLTLLLPRAEAVPDAVTAGRALVGVRVPAHPAAQALLRAVALPLAAPSANRFGHVSPTTAEHVLADLDGCIDAVLDAGPCHVGLESTVLDPQPTPMRIYRAGAVTLEAIKAVSHAEVEMFVPAKSETSRPESLPSPGVGIRHYAPIVPLLLTDPSPEALRSAVAALAQGGRSAGVLVPAGWVLAPEPQIVQVRWGAWGDLQALAAGLFAGLRALEDAGVDAIVCPLPESGGLGDALRDRLLKSCPIRITCSRGSGDSVLKDRSSA